MGLWVLFCFVRVCGGPPDNSECKFYDSLEEIICTKYNTKSYGIQ